jgi:hypothetical protein
MTSEVDILKTVAREAVEFPAFLKARRLVWEMGEVPPSKYKTALIVRRVVHDYLMGELWIQDRVRVLSLTGASPDPVALWESIEDHVSDAVLADVLSGELCPPNMRFLISLDDRGSHVTGIKSDHLETPLDGDLF